MKLSASQHLKFASLMHGKAMEQADPKLKAKQLMLGDTHLKLARKAAERQRKLGDQ